MKILLLLFFAFLTFNHLYAQSNADSLIKKLKVSDEFVTHENRLSGYLKFDNKGNLVFHNYDNFIGGPISTSSVNIYNTNNQLSQSKSIHSSYPNDTSVSNYNYDSQGNLLSVTDKDKIVVFRYKNDSLKRKINQEQLDKSGDVISETSFKYDSKGNVIQQIISNKHIQNRINTTQYDSLNRVIRGELWQDNLMRFAVHYTYDSKTGLLMKTLYDEDGSGKQLDGVLYLYDEKLRLIKRSQFEMLNGRDKVNDYFESFSYYDNNLTKNYTENINSFNHQIRTFVYYYKFFH